MVMLRKWLILAHRYLGIALGLLFVIWFLSGIVMMYTGGMPELTQQARLERLPNLDIARVRVSPGAVASGRIPERITLLTVMDRPAYRFSGGRIVFADTGEALTAVTLTQARRIAASFLNCEEGEIQDAGLLSQADQWTLTQARQLPAFKFTVDDAPRTELYVATQTADVLVATTRRSRTLAWIGAIPHWLYFTPLRLNARLWTRTVVWLSALGCVSAFLGLVLGVVQYRRSKPPGVSSSIPYTGWMRWHYLTGVVFGLFTLTWAFSGLLSMEPFAWTRREGLEVDRAVFSGGPPRLAEFPAFDASRWDALTGGRAIKEIDYAWIQDKPYYVTRLAPKHEAASARAERLHQPYPITGQAVPDRLIVDATTLEIKRWPFSVESLVNRLETAGPKAPIIETALLTEYDAYYYSRSGQTPLPVLRVKFDDPDRTWIYVDPEMGQLLGSVHRFSRVERWLFNGLHSLDFSFWYHKRPLWDIGMILLSLGGFASSGIGLWVGIKRVRRRVLRSL
jgi:uncharacterized iron-regulated membrane protein